MSGDRDGGPNLVDRIAQLEARFQHFADRHSWICLATKNDENTAPELGQLTDGRWPPMFYPLVSTPQDPRTVPILDQVSQLTNEASDLLFAVLGGPHDLPAKLVEDIRYWENEGWQTMWGGWTCLVRYVVRSQHIYVFPNYSPGRSNRALVPEDEVRSDKS